MEPFVNFFLNNVHRTLLDISLFVSSRDEPSFFYVNHSQSAFADIDRHVFTSVVKITV